MAHYWSIETPPEYNIAFYNQPWVQRELGVPVNFTLNSAVLVGNFDVTGDAVLRTISSLNHVLSSGLNVALIYGDRDYRCNCTSPLLPLTLHP